MEILTSKRMLEDDKIELAAQKALEGWKTAGQALENEDPEPEMDSTTYQEQETPSKATINLSTDKTGLEKKLCEKKSCERESGKKDSDQASLEKLTTLALSLLEG